MVMSDWFKGSFTRHFPLLLSGTRIAHRDKVARDAVPIVDD
jgi:hypothetical protein